MSKVWNCVVSSLAVNETGLAFEGCSFESDTCGWEDISVGQRQWARRNSNNSNDGPSTDNTLGSKLGEETCHWPFSQQHTHILHGLLE